MLLTHQNMLATPRWTTRAQRAKQCVRPRVGKRLHGKVSLCQVNTWRTQAQASHTLRQPGPHRHASRAWPRRFTNRQAARAVIAELRQDPPQLQADNAVNFEQMHKTPATHVDICGRSVSLLEGTGDDKTLIVAADDGCVKVEDVTTDILERMIQTLPRAFQGHFASPESIAAMPCNVTGMDSEGIAAAVANVTQDMPPGSGTNFIWGLDLGHQDISVAHIPKMTIPMLAHSVKTLVQGKEPAVALKVVEFALQTRPDNILLQSWRQTLFNATANVEEDMEAIASALQPYVPDNPAAIADCARVRFYVGDQPLTLDRPFIGPPSITGLLELSKVLDLNPGDAQNLARLAYMTMWYTNDFLGGLRLLQHADQMSPVQDFHILKWAAEHCSNIDTTCSISILDRMLQMQPHTYAPRLAYAWVFQQRGACKFTLGQIPEALADLQMAAKLGHDDADTYKHLGQVYHSMGNRTAALSAFDSAHCEAPDDSDALICRGALKREMGDSVGAVADFDLAEALEPLPEEVALARQQLMLDM